MRVPAMCPTLYWMATGVPVECALNLDDVRVPPPSQRKAPMATPLKSSLFRLLLLCGPRGGLQRWHPTAEEGGGRRRQGLAGPCSAPPSGLGKLRGGAVGGLFVGPASPCPQGLSTLRALPPMRHCASPTCPAVWLARWLLRRAVCAFCGVST